MKSATHTRRITFIRGISVILLASLLLVASCKKDEVSATATISGFSPASGPVGSVVIITGSNFNMLIASNHVMFNGTAAVVSAASSVQLTVTVPTGASTGKITVSNGSGASASSSTSFTVTP